VFIAHPGAGIRTSDCASLLVCPTFDYWQHRLASVGSRVRPDVIVNDLGVNDAIRPGTINARGYAYYGLKIDHMMRLTPAIPVIWTNTPCTLEPAALVVGCKAVNTALRTAPARCTRP
jgi:hypothetical protein